MNLGIRPKCMLMLLPEIVPEKFYNLLRGTYFSVLFQASLKKRTLFFTFPPGITCINFPFKNNKHSIQGINNSKVSIEYSY